MDSLHFRDIIDSDTLGVFKIQLHPPDADKRTDQIRRERRSVYEDAGVSVTAYQGDAITDDMLETAFFIYKSTIDKVAEYLAEGPLPMSTYQRV